jgi:hypothetical protein
MSVFLSPAHVSVQGLTIQGLALLLYLAAFVLLQVVTHDY